MAAPQLNIAAWCFLALLLLSGFFTLVALSRAGIRHFWTQLHSSMPALRALEVLPVAALLIAAVVVTVMAEPVMQHARDTARGLFTPTAYRQAVLEAQQVRPAAPRPGVQP